MLPPGIRKEWDENSPWQKCLIIAYDQIREIEESDLHFKPMEVMLSAFATTKR